MRQFRLDCLLEFHWPVWRAMRGMLDFRDLLVLSMTSKLMNQLVAPLLMEMNDIDGFLGCFTKTPSCLRQQLKVSGGIISGDVPRSFFLGRRPPNKMTILIVEVNDLNRKALRLCGYLFEEDYTTCDLDEYDGVNVS